MDFRINVFILPLKSVSPQINYSEDDIEKDPSYARLLRLIERDVENAKTRKARKCDISIDVERHKIPAVKKLLEKKGYSVFVQGVYV